MPMLILPQYDTAGADLDSANLAMVDRIADAFGGCPVTYPAQTAAHNFEAGCVDAAPGLAVEFASGSDSFATRAMVATIARAYAAETGCARLIYFRDAHNAEVLEIQAPAAWQTRAA